MELNLMPAELVAKVVHDNIEALEGSEISEQAPGVDMIDAIRHAWIEAAQALEDYAMNEGGEFCYKELREAARALRQAAREDVEP